MEGYTLELTCPDNTNPKWWRDAGLRRMAMHIIALYLCVFTFGVSTVEAASFATVKADNM